MAWMSPTLPPELADSWLWNGDHTRPNALSRLRYHQMFIPRIMDEMRRGPLPAGADTVSWRY